MPNRIKYFAVVLLLAAVYAVPTPAWCWDKFAHEVICQIAIDHMTPAARNQEARMIDTLNADPDVTGLRSEFQPYNAVTAGAWLDDLKTITKRYSAWHYINLPLDPDITRAQVVAFRDRNTSNAYLTIALYCLPTLRNKTASPSDRARALGFFLHVAGDIHQPLHAVGIDEGGNRYPIAEIPSADSTWKIHTLHPFWDNAYRYSGANGSISVVIPYLDEPRIARAGDQPVRQVATLFEHEYASKEHASAEDLDPADWAVESCRIAATFVYPALQGGHVLTPAYVQRSSVIARERIVLAGLRIAAILNSTLGTGDPAVR